MDRNPFHFAHLDASDASLSGIAVAYEFHEACRDTSTPPVLAILQTCLQNLKWSHILAMSSSRWIRLPSGPLAERTELTPSRLFSSARRNCSREGSLSTITCRRIANHVAMQKSAAMEQATFTNHFCHCHQPKMSIIPYSY